MPSINSSEDVGRRKRIVIISIAVGLVVVCAGLYWFRVPPQMGASEEVFDSVDALFTAVTAHDEKRLADCEKRLMGYAETGKLTAPAWKYLDGIIQKARGGGWQSAAESLYDFMLVQRREGFEGHPKPTPATKPKKK